MDRTKTMPSRVDCLIDLYKDTSSGHFFDKDTMRFFKSKGLGDFKKLDDKTALFITSETSLSGVKAYTVRLAQIKDNLRDGGDLVSKVEIETLGEFHQLTKYMAQKILNNYKKDLDK